MTRRLLAPLAAIVLSACQPQAAPPAYTPSPAGVSAAQPDGRPAAPGNGPLVLDGSAIDADPFLPEANDYGQPAGEARYPVDLTQGSWQVAGGAASGCLLRFGYPGPDGGAAASARNCATAQLAEVSSWRGAGERIELFSADGSPVAYLYADRPDLLTGYLVDGPELIVSR